jgi:hypothetical protein
MTTSPSEPVDNAQVSDADELPSGGYKDDILSDGRDSSDETDQDAEPTSTAPAENNPTVPDPPD